MFTENAPNNDSQDLKQLREAKGLSLEDLFKRTRVRVIYLQAIENKEFNLLPVPVYSKNFIRIYARTLGIDSEPIIKEYEDYVNSQQKGVPQPEDVEKENFSFAIIAGKKKYLAIAIVLLIVIIAHWLISKQYESSSDLVNPSRVNSTNIDKAKKVDASISLSQQAENEFVTALEEKFNPSPISKGKTTADDEANANASPKKVLPPVANINDSNDKEASLLVVRAIEDTWFRIKADQKPSLQVFLKAGEKFEQKAASFDIDLGNAGGVKIKFKGKNIENLGKTGEVVHLRLP